MATFRANGVESVSIVRKDDENRSLELQIECEDGASIAINVGMYYDDAETLRDLLREAAEDFTKSELSNWEDVPDFDDDGVVFDADREVGYYVRLSGHYWHDDCLLPHDQERKANPFPTRDIAAYELARAMSDQGYFPNVWYQNDRGNCFDIGEEVRKWHDEGGDKPIALEGVVFQKGDEVLVDGDSASIIKDYGTLGIVFSYDNSGDNEYTDDRETVVPYADCKHCERLIIKKGDVWIDPNAPATPEDGDDHIWRETCDANDAFVAVHEPVE